MRYPLKQNVSLTPAERVVLTLSCKDCARIPKVRNAGRVIDENGRRIQIMHNGVRVVAGGYYGPFIEEIITGLKGHHEPQEELVFHHILKFVPGKATMIELGGFWSYYSLWFLRQGRPGWLGRRAQNERRVIVLEPDPNHIAIGRENAELNGETIEFVQACIGERPIPEIAFPTESAGEIRMPQASVQQLMDERAIQHLDILHCDTQGAETAVVASMRDLFAQGRVSFCVVSTHSHHISGDPLTHQRCLAMLREAGGRILAEHDVQESFSGDGLIAAYFGKKDIAWPEIHMSYARYSGSLFRNPLYDLDEIQSG